MAQSSEKLLPSMVLALFLLFYSALPGQFTCLDAVGEQWVGGAAGSAGGIRYELTLSKKPSRVLGFDSVYVGYADSGQWVPVTLVFPENGKWMVSSEKSAGKGIDTFRLRCSVRIFPAYQKPVNDQDIIHKENKTPWVAPPVPITTSSTERVVLIRWQRGKKYRYVLADKVQVKKVLVP